jgi:hypothetical protein
MLRLRSTRGQATTEYLGLLVIVALIVLALVAVVPGAVGSLERVVHGAICRLTGCTITLHAQAKVVPPDVPPFSEAYGLVQRGVDQGKKALLGSDKESLGERLLHGARGVGRAAPLFGIGVGIAEGAAKGRSPGEIALRTTFSTVGGIGAGAVGATVAGPIGAAGGGTAGLACGPAAEVCVPAGGLSGEAVASALGAFTAGTVGSYAGDELAGKLYEEIS